MSADQVSSVEEIVRPDLYWSYSTDYKVVSLEVEQVEITKDSYDWTVSGSVVNTSGENLSSIGAVFQLLDDNGQVMATSSTTMYPIEGAETIEPGTSNDFSISIYAPEDWDLASQDHQVILQGIVSQ